MPRDVTSEGRGGKPEPDLENQQGSINGFRVDQLMATAFHCCDSECTDNLIRISARATLWCNANVYTQMLSLNPIMPKEEINALSSSDLKL